MVQLRPRKRPGAHLPTSGSDHPGPCNADASEHGAEESCIVPSLPQPSQQVLGSCSDERVVVRKRGRKPKSRTPVGCVIDEINGKQTGLIKEIGKSVDLPVGNITSDNAIQRLPRKRGTKPQCCCGQISCNDVPTVSHDKKLPKKKGRKPKCQKSESQIIKTSERKQYVSAVLGEKSDVRRKRGFTVSNLSVLLNDVKKSSCSQSSTSTKQTEVRKRGRKPLNQSLIQCEVSESCVSEAIPKSGSSKRGQVVGCTSDVKEPGKNKRGRKPGPLIRKKLQATQQHSNVSNVSNVMKKPLPEPSVDQQAEEETSTRQLPCCKMELRNSRKTRSAPALRLLKQEVPYSAEKNATSPMQILDPSRKLNDEEKSKDCTISEISVNKCSTNTCNAYARGLPNPIVRLENCKSLHKQPCTDTKTLAVKSMSAVKDLSTQNKVSSDNIVTSNNACLSALDKAENNDVFESTSIGKKPRLIRRLITVKQKCKKKAQKVNMHIERGDSHSTGSDSTTMKVRNEGTEFRVEQPDNVKLSYLHNDDLLEETNNNTITHVNSEEINEVSVQKTTEGTYSCISWNNWRDQSPILSEEEISDRDSINKWAMSPSNAGYSNSSQTVEKEHVSCQRIVPFSGKSIWKCSCARTCVWDFARKVAADSTEILGIKAERSLEIYSSYMPHLFESISEESMQGRTEDINSEVLDKETKLCSENSPHSINTSVSILDESHCTETEITTDEADDGRVASVPLPSEAKSMEENLATSIDFESDDIQNTSPPTLSSDPQKADKNHPVSKSPEKSGTILKLSDSFDIGKGVTGESPIINRTPTISYLEDILVLDVIPDDPDLFDFSSEEEIHFSNSKIYTSISKPKMKQFIPKEKPSPDIKSKAHTQRIEHSFDSYIDESNDFNTELSAVSVLTPPSGTQHTDNHVDITGQLLDISQLPDQAIDCQYNGKNMPLLAKENSSQEKRKPEFSYFNPEIQTALLPYGYCKFFFNTLKGCFRKQCSFLHVPMQCDEKICMDLLRKLLNEKHALLLRRAVWIFTQYYGQHLPREHYDKSIFNALINPSLNMSCWPDVFHLLETAVTAKILPSVDLLIKVFQRVSSTGLNTAMSHLLDIFCKLVDHGLNCTSVEIHQIIATVNPLTASTSHVKMLMSIKSRFYLKPSKQNWTRDLGKAIAEVEHCKLNSNWMKLGNLYLHVCRGCENITDLKKFSRCVAEALMKNSDEERSEVPYCEFADTIIKNPPLNDILKNILGRIGISVMFYYHRKELWQKGRRVLCKLKELQINYTVLKGLAVQESVASRCHVVNIAVEIFLMCGNLITACKVLKESDWIMNTTTWPCERMDVLKRHNLLCALVQEALSKSMYTMCFDVLQNLPGFQESQADITVSQYLVLFNKVLSSSVENRCLGISSSIVDFMVANKIPVEYVSLQQLITTLGHSGLWPKARKHYKDALSFGFYTLLEGNKDHKILHIPSSMSDVEMLITVEHFMVTNASSIQSPGGSNESLQIVLKRVEADKAQCEDSYHTAIGRLLEASRMSSPRLFLKHMTVNSTKEQVYILDHNSSLKWLHENLKWAGTIWSNQ
ncbi:protein TOPAZ1 isoform X2 [Pseudophryne corroboree]|uniref:protein TOPAZ1 isoform X2 n=1 Tax=Pseudophryne corroboree TaxID=495146 RepID=UPI003081923B